MEILGNKKALGLLTLAGLMLVFSMYALALPFSESHTVIYWFWVMILLVLTLIAVSWSSLFPYSKVTFMAVLLATTVSVLFLFPWNGLQIVSALGIALGIYLMKRAVTWAEKESLHFSYFRSVKNGQMLFLSAVSLLIALNVYLQTSESLQKDPDDFYRRMSGSVVRSVEPVLQSKIQGFSPSQTLDEFLLSSTFFEDNLEDNSCLRNRTKQFCPDLTLAQKRESFLKAFGVEAGGNEQVVEILARVVSVRIQDFFQPVQKFVPAIYALVLFLSLRFIMLAVSFVAAALGSIIFKVALKIGFVRLAEKNVTVEIPEI